MTITFSVIVTIIIVIVIVIIQVPYVSGLEEKILHFLNQEYHSAFNHSLLIALRICSKYSLKKYHI